MVYGAVWLLVVVIMVVVWLCCFSRVVSSQAEIFHKRYLPQTSLDLNVPRTLASTIWILNFAFSNSKRTKELVLGYDVCRVVPDATILNQLRRWKLSGSSVDLSSSWSSVVLTRWWPELWSIEAATTKRADPDIIPRSVKDDYFLKWKCWCWVSCHLIEQRSSSLNMNIISSSPSGWCSVCLFFLSSRLIWSNLMNNVLLLTCHASHIRSTNAAKYKSVCLRNSDQSQWQM